MSILQLNMHSLPDYSNCIDVEREFATRSSKFEVHYNEKQECSSEDQATNLKQFYVHKTRINLWN